MRKFKILTVFLFMIILLTGCLPKKSTLETNPPSSLEVSSEQNSVKTVTIKPEEPLKSTPVIPKPEGKSNENKQVPSPKVEIKEINGMVLLSSLDKDIVIQLKYATTNNFTKKIIYPNSVCVLRKNTASKLASANAKLKKLGYRIKVWDAYRPLYVQQIFWDIVKDSRFVASPKNGGSIHNRGSAVDVTLVDINGKELNLPSKFDDFSPKAYRSNSKMTSEAKKNMDLLTKSMVASGFTTINTEWWHFEDSNSRAYKIVDVNLKLFLN